MEPPSSISSDKRMKPEGGSDDYRLHPYLSDSLLIITRPSEENAEGLYVVCAYSAKSGLSYIGTMGGDYS